MRHIYAHSGSTGDARISPDGMRIVFSSNASSTGASEIFTLNSDGSGVQQITTYNDNTTGSARFVHDGAKIWYLRAGNLYEMNPDGSGLKQLTSNSVHGYITHYGVDKKETSVYYTTSAGLYFAKIDLSGAVEIKNKGGWGGYYYYVQDVSSDGSQVLVWVLNSELYVSSSLRIVNSDGSWGATVWEGLNKMESIDSAIWSPDGTKIAYAAKKVTWSGDGTGVLGRADVYLANADGSTVFSAQNITNTPDTDESVDDWQAIFGYTGTVPVTGDFDGDGKDDIGGYYAPGGNWYLLDSSDGFRQALFGFSGTSPIVGDFDGDGKDDIGCYDPVGGTWYLFRSKDGYWRSQ